MARTLSTEPTPPQVKILEAIARDVASGKPSPTHADLARLFTSTGPAGVLRHHLLTLERLGLLGRTGANARFYVPTAGGWARAGIVPPAGVPLPLPPDAPIATAVREAFAAGEPLPPRVLAVLEAVA